MKKSRAPKASDSSGAEKSQRASERQDPPKGDLSPVHGDSDRVLSPEVLDQLPANVREVVLRAASFSGPLPPSQMYREYELVVPGSGERILKMAEDQQAHRIQWEKTAISEESRATTRGQWFGFIVALACIGSAVYLAMSGEPWVAGILGGVGGIGLVGHFVNSLRNGSK